MSGFHIKNFIDAHRIFMINIKYFIVALLLSILIILPTLYTKLEVFQLLVLVMVFTMWIEGIFEWIFDLPNIYIKNDKSNKSKVRILLLLVYSFALYLLVVGLLHVYYPFLENIVGAKFLLEHFKF